MLTAMNSTPKTPRRFESDAVEAAVVAMIDSLK
jgi:hypothetical protein